MQLIAMTMGLALLHNSLKVSRCSHCPGDPLPSITWANARLEIFEDIKDLATSTILSSAINFHLGWSICTSYYWNVTLFGYKLI